MSNNISNLIASAVRQNDLDPDASLVLIDNLDAVALAGSNGVGLDEISGDDVTLVAVVLDESSSMSGFRQEVIKGFNSMLQALQQSHHADSILLSTWTFNTQPNLAFSYTPVTKLGGLTSNDYHPSGSTALYDTLLKVMTGLVAYGQSLRDNGVRTRGVVIVFSDGEDNSSQATAQQIRQVSQALLAQEIYVLAYVGFGGIDLRTIAAEVGFPEVLTTAASASEIRRIFQQVSASIIRGNRAGAAAGSFF